MIGNPFLIGVFISSPSVGLFINKLVSQKDHILKVSYDGLEDAIPKGKQMEENGVEVIISRRGTAFLLRENLRIPVLSLPESSLSKLNSIREASLRGKRIFMPCFREKQRGLSFITELLDIELSQAVYTDSSSLRQIVYNAKMDKYDVVIGGLSTKRYADEVGIEFCELLSSEEEVIEAIENAKSVAQSQRERKTVTRRYQTIMDATSDGIIAIDPDGNITTMNQAARSMLKIKGEEIQGLNVERFLGKSALTRVFENEKPVRNKIKKIDKELFVFNHIPVMVNNKILGIVSSFKEAANVMQAENKVRRTLAKGFVATYEIEDLIYDSSSMSKVANACRDFSTTDSCILLSGETGTGKEILAQSIHNLSRRKSKPFVSVNCGGISEQLLESELFGYEEGAFTGTKKGGKPGLFELAHQGTIFLDEIDSTSLSVQLHLLRVLQEKEVMRLGAVNKVPINVRVLAATGKPLWEAVQNGTFRKDLFFRLNVLTISIPPLRERKEDFPKLLNHFILYYAKKYKIKPPALPRSYIEKLMDYSWPGNIRQIKHFSESLILNCNSQQSDDILDHLLNELTSIVESEQKEAKEPIRDTSYTDKDLNDFSAIDSPPNKPEHTILKRNTVIEAHHIKSALEASHYNRSKAAELLGIGRTTLWRKMKEFRIE